MKQSWYKRQSSQAWLLRLGADFSTSDSKSAYVVKLGIHSPVPDTTSLRWKKQFDIKIIL